jgi:glycosyltransferase involved in cell wall biosynthesis
MPDISVILPVYNGMDYLKQSVESVLKQKNADFELIIIDDCSTDNSNQYLQSLNDKRLRLFTNESNKGLFWNLNFLISKASAPLIKLWAQDDIMYPECLSVFIEFHKNHSDIGFMYSMVRYIDELGAYSKPDKIDTTPEIISSDLHAHISFEYGCIAGNISNTCITRKALDKVGLFNEQMCISADFEMWVRIAQYYPIGFIKKSLIKLRDHDKQLSRNKKYYIDHVIEDLQVYKYLQSYVSPYILRQGLRKFRENKLMFYYTLMVKALINGDIITTIKYFKILYKEYNFFILTINFIRTKIYKPVNT